MNELEENANIHCILNEQEDYPFYDAEFILSQFEFANSEEEDEEKEEDKEEDKDEDKNDKEENDDEDSTNELDQLSLFDKSAKQLAIICEYYCLNKTKLKKQDMIENILQFENDPLNSKIMKTRYKIWKVMDKLKMDKVMKKYIIWI